ncbi:MAG: chemotaxis protein [Gammaproteobacteria bacterium]|nr:chemotaxis protein [Gammaproteobacteria bacterium]MBU1603344.1 chemotaxis protein [Gammaproteobacteria bacterium]MBU2432864.1 chemotaxis protein [Gammaproteobacteria bacterium]MBU2450107.1 chemotaxis protein [Gammaproteobacteria bacterium]
MTTALTTRPSKAQQAGVDLLRIVRINEEIKAVVGVAFKINIMALNAIFLAKRAGTAARGFGVLSNELRVFSQDLRDGMSALTTHIHACVTEVSVVLQDIRHTALLRQAVEQSSAACGPAVLAAREVENDRHAERLARLRKQLRAALDDAFRMVELGGVLAKSAKIEAAYGQSFAVPLAQVSGEFDGVVEEIRASLESLRRSAFFTGN